MIDFVQIQALTTVVPRGKCWTDTRGRVEYEDYLNVPFSM